MKPILASLVLVGAIVGSAAGAQQGPSKPGDTSHVGVTASQASLPKAKIRLIGIYGDSGILEGVEVQDLLTGTSARTTSTGTAALNFLTFKGGAALVQLRKPGYAPKQIVVANDSSDITEVLERAPLGDTTRAQPLPAMLTIAPGSADWNARCGHASGCIRPGVLQDTAYQSKTIAAALGMNGIDIRLAYRSRGGNCGMQILVNGARTVLTLQDPAPIFTAAEFYSTALMTPEQFARRDGKACGTLVLWTVNHP